jgi:Fe-S cluster assembly iron-binding protein IscA
MILEMTPRAAHRLSQIMTKDANPDLALRVRVEAGGCHGFQYLMSLTTLASPPPPPPQPSSDATGRIPPDAAEVARDVTPSTTTSNAPSPAGLGEDDTVFAFVKDGEVDDDAQTLASRPKMVLDGPSLELLKGSKVDFTMELIGSQFKIVDNPLATSSCGCGTSFDVKL